MATDEHSTPGEPPPVRDEAADSPLWLPALGLTLLLLGAIFIVWRSSATELDAGDAAAEETAEEAPGDPAEEPAEGEAEAAPE